jgi:xanthine dehydrogenase accessory factor
MREVTDDIDGWLAEGLAVGLATVVETWGSAPRGTGAKMAFTADGQISGSVSGGCVEGAVYETGLEVLETGRPQLIHFGVADETAWEVGLACGGTIDLFVERLDPAVYRFCRDLLAQDEAFAMATVISGPPAALGKKLVVQRGSHVFGDIGAELDKQAAVAARSSLNSGRSHRHKFEHAGAELFIDVSPVPPILIMVGGVHIAIALAKIAKGIGYRTIVIDPRRSFGSQERFPHVDQIIQAWPDEALAGLKLTPSTAVAVLTHDPKIDDLALRAVLPQPVFYVGALGSKSTQEKRRRRLQQAGVTEGQIGRIFGPIGLDIGARTPEEIAVAIMAEIIAASNQRSY